MVAGRHRCGGFPAARGCVFYSRIVIYLLRHGEAEDANPEGDAARRLTEKGERQGRDAGLALAALEVGIDACIASPKVRALATARLACEALGVEVEVSE